MDRTIFTTTFTGLITVDWRPGSFPYDTEVAGMFFPGRELMVSADEIRWYGVTCSADEWEDFIASARDAVLNSEPVGTTQALQLIDRLETDYNRYLADVIAGPWINPLTANRLADAPRYPPFIPPAER